MGIKKYTGNLIRMFRYLRNMAPQLFVLVLAIAVMEAVLPYVNVIAMQLMIGGLTEQKGSRTIISIIIITIAVNVLARLITGILRRKREVSEVQLELGFQEKLSIHEMRLSLADIESAEIAEIKRNIEQAKMRNGGIEKIVSDFEMVVRNVVSLVTAGIIFTNMFAGQGLGGSTSFWTSPAPVLILVLLVIICVMISVKLQAAQILRVSELNDQANQANGSAFAYMQFISNYHFGKEIRIFELGDYLCNYFEHLWTSSIGYALTKKLGKEKAKIPCMTVFCNGILNIFVYILAIGKAWAKEISVGNVIVYINSVQAFIQAIVELIGANGEIIGHGVLMQPFLELLDKKEEITASGQYDDMPSEIEKIEFEHVYFKYPEQENWVLEDVNFTLKKGQKMALVGENGAGKSTIIKLICRFYEPERGSIKIDGVDIGKYGKKQYWDKLSVVFQDFSLPALEIGSVISGREMFDAEKETAILRKIGMDKWMEKLNLSLDHYIYNDFADAGIEISGGEGQKLAIARAIYKDAPMIILDEPTAALDPVSEASVFQDFHRMCQNKTCIFISHRLYSCRICDFVLVLHNGKVAQQGTHEELLRCEGIYKELWNSQAALYKEDEYGE